MEISANFAFLKQEFPHAAESASYAEQHVYGDPRASCFHARHALERLVMRVYKVDKTLEVRRRSRTWTATSMRPCLPRPRSRGHLAEGRVHPASGQRGGTRKEDRQQAGDCAGHRAGAFARLLLGGPHVPAEGGGKPVREDLRRITRPESGTGSCAGQRRGTGRSEGGAGRCRGGSQGAREGAGGIACTARGDQGGERSVSPRPTTGTRTRLDGCSSISR